MSELQSLFSEQPEAEANETPEVEQTAPEVAAEDSPEQQSGDENTDEINHTSETEDADTSSQESGDETKPSLEQVTITLDESEYDLELPPEIAEKVKAGVMMNHDYTKKSQALAEQRKSFEAEQAEARQKQEDILTEMASQLLFLQSELESPEMQQLKEFDKAEFDRRKAEYTDRYDAYKKHIEERNAKLTEERKTQIEEFRKQETENLKVMIPEWLDESKKSEEMKSIGNYSRELGFTNEDLQRIDTARLMRVFRDAAKYSQAQKNIQTKKSKPTVTPVKSSAKPESVKEKPLWEHFYGE